MLLQKVARRCNEYPPASGKLVQKRRRNARRAQSSAAARKAYAAANVSDVHFGQTDNQSPHSMQSSSLEGSTSAEIDRGLSLAPKYIDFRRSRENAEDCAHRYSGLGQAWRPQRWPGSALQLTSGSEGGTIMMKLSWKPTDILAICANEADLGPLEAAGYRAVMAPGPDDFGPIPRAEHYVVWRTVRANA